MEQRQIQKPALLQVEHLSVQFTQYGRGFRKHRFYAVRDLSLTVREKELVAVVGSSGSGKSLLAHGVLGLLPYNAGMGGTVSFQGEPLDERRLKQLRGREIVFVPQGVSHLDPLMKIGSQMRMGKNDPETKAASRHALERYGLGAEAEEKYPFELSGGMARRVLIGTAVMASPRLVIADEPTPGLHLRAARRVLSHFRELADEGAGVLLITHDLELALEVADRIVVFYAGTNVEEALAADFQQENTLRHPYTRALFQAMPRNGFHPTPGVQPYGKEMPKGCPYGPRCPWAEEACRKEIPYRSQNGGWVRCRKTWN